MAKNDQKADRVIRFIKKIIAQNNIGTNCPNQNTVTLKVEGTRICDD
jgi:hypothetical protein